MPVRLDGDEPDGEHDDEDDRGEGEEADEPDPRAARAVPLARAGVGVCAAREALLRAGVLRGRDEGGRLARGRGGVCADGGAGDGGREGGGAPGGGRDVGGVGPAGGGVGVCVRVGAPDGGAVFARDALGRGEVRGGHRALGAASGACGGGEVGELVFRDQRREGGARDARTRSRKRAL